MNKRATEWNKMMTDEYAENMYMRKEYGEMSDLISKSDAINAIMSCPNANPEYPLYFAEKIKNVPTIQQKQEYAMSHVKKYVIEKEGYSTIIVNLTEREARVIENFLDWACLEDDFYIESVEEYEADEWGKSDGTN